MNTRGRLFIVTLPYIGSLYIFPHFVISGLFLIKVEKENVTIFKILILCELQVCLNTLFSFVVSF